MGREVLTNAEKGTGLSSEVSCQKNHCRIIIEFFELEETFKGHLLPPPCPEQGHPQLHQVLRAPSSLTLAVSRDGAPPPLCNLCQCLAALSAKTFFIYSSPLLVSNHFPMPYHSRPCYRQHWAETNGLLYTDKRRRKRLKNFFKERRFLCQWNR